MHVKDCSVIPNIVCHISVVQIYEITQKGRPVQITRGNYQMRILVLFLCM